MRKINNEVVDLFDISQCYPYIFWKECDKCGDLVKREIMWVVMNYSHKWGNTYCPIPIDYKYFCLECFKDSVNGREELHRYCKIKSA